MVLSRRLDDKEIQLKDQSLIFFQISGAGHEAILTAAGMLLKRGHDWFYPYYRDRALCLALGVTPYEMLLAAVGTQGRPCVRRPPDAVALGPQGAQHRLAVEPDRHAVPPGDRMRRSGPPLRADRRDPRARRPLRSPTKSPTCRSATAATSEGEFWESLNAACLTRLPVLFLVEDNGYAISVPVEVQTAGGDISRLVSSFPDLYVRSIDGTDFPTSYRTLEEAIAYVRQRRGPGPRARPRDAALLALPLGRRAAVQDCPTSGRSRRRAIRSCGSAAMLIAAGLATDADLEAIAAGNRPAR